MLKSALVLCLLSTFSLLAAPSVVKLEKTGEGYRLLRNGTPYYIKGAGGGGSLKELAARGGNSVRTWGFDGNTKYLDEAHKLGLSVSSGLWLGHPQHGFKYGDSKALWSQLNNAEKWIKSHRDHPALLIWAVGNEMEGDGNNPAIWYAVNDIARLCKRLDPNHPTMTVIAEIGGAKVKNIHRFCPDIDIVGINTYGGIGSIGKRYKAAGGTKPYIVTEFGPPGQWECAKTKFGAPLEMNSTRKAEWYLKGYQDGIAAHPDTCLGSYAFTWGWKVEATPTWYGLFLPDGSRTAAIESMAKAWGGPLPKNRCPVTSDVKTGKTDGLKPEEIITASVTVSDPEQDKITYQWILYPEAHTYAVMGTGLKMPEGIKGAILKQGSTATVKMPKSGGKYRLYAIAHDGNGNASQANIPLRVDGPVIAGTGSKVKFPFTIYTETDRDIPYIPSGYMGNATAMKVEASHTGNPHGGKACMKVSYNSDKGWGGVVWQSPANDWGDRAGGFDLSGAGALEFWARGETGTEKVTFGVGIIGKGKKYPDSAMASISEISLSKMWKKYIIPLQGKDLTRIKSGFYWSLSAQGQGIAFYLDDIVFK